MLVVRKNKYEELEKLRRKTNAIRLVEGLLLGLAIGALIAFLLTPWDGKRSRSYVKGQFGGLREKCRSLWSGCSWCGCGACDEVEENEDPLEGFYDD